MPERRRWLTCASMQNAMKNLADDHNKISTCTCSFIFASWFQWILLLIIQARARRLPSRTLLSQLDQIMETAAHEILGRKGPMLLGVKAVIAKSFKRIHRSNLVDMGDHSTS
ncbi:hypothetical protein V6N13_129333 [Hibiscus sabdariffa]|uniref:Aconitase A/isopropylmalate dehydratase small subunit swivel domain-containing protein n=2 Tax=Hibiscus sabdariffa TaxID=183260 RepID=A0ABR1ZVP2_9ROSI